MTRTYWCERAWVDGAVRDGVLLRADDRGVLTEVRTGVPFAGVSTEACTSDGADASDGLGTFVVAAPAGAEPRSGVGTHDAVQRVAGIVFPGGVNAHSHAFHRLLRGRTHADGGTFWTWRNVMYDMAARLTPDSYRVVARAVFAEMLAGGWTSVGEFHYVHHAPDGRPYGESDGQSYGEPDGQSGDLLRGEEGRAAGQPHAMELALAAAAEDVGIRMRLLDTCYLTGAIGEDLSAEQARFGDGDIDGYLARHASLAAALEERAAAVAGGAVVAGRGAAVDRGAEDERAATSASGDRDEARGTSYRSGGHPNSRVLRTGNRSLGGGTPHTPSEADGHGLVSLGAAIHSVRAVPADAIARFTDLSGPVHIHLSEQPAENEACLAAYDRTPTGVLEDAGVLGPHLSPVHATHLTDDDIAALGSAGTTIVMCPTTEADLADGIGPALDLADAGATIALGSDQHVVLDALRELQGLEAGERLRSGVRGRFTPAQLIDAVTSGGARSLGLPVGAFEVGRACDFIAVDPLSPRTYGAVGEQVVLAGTSADVHTVVTAGQVRVRDGVHEQLGDLSELYREAYAAIGHSVGAAGSGVDSGARADSGGGTDTEAADTTGGAEAEGDAEAEASV